MGLDTEMKIISNFMLSRIIDVIVSHLPSLACESKLLSAAFSHSLTSPFQIF